MSYSSHPTAILRMSPALIKSSCEGPSTLSNARVSHLSSRHVQCVHSKALSSDAIPSGKSAHYEGGRGRNMIDEITERRAKAGKLVAGIAAASDSDMFKGPQTGKPKAKRWDNHLSQESRERKPCTLKQAAKFLKKPGLISLGGGLPSSQLFPIAELGMKVPKSPNFSEQATIESGQHISIGKYDVRDHDSEYDLSIALNYGQSTGSAQMMRFITEHTELVCRPPYADWRVCQTIGSTGALEQAIRMFCDKDRQDSILTEEFSFSTALETFAPLGINMFGVKIDEQGLIPEAMDEMLSNWDVAARGGARKPHVLYTVPSGQNPTGATQGTERRKAIYQVAQKHDIYILEDEPYYFLQMQPYTGADQPPADAPASVDEFVSSLIPSLVSIDIDGRVMRMDSFSKVLIPGSRMGWVVASEQIIERYQRHAEVASQGPSGLSQVVLWKLLDDTWGHEGYFQWLINLREEYTHKRDKMLAACEEHLPQSLVSWTPPVAGMFMWLTVDHTQHPSGDATDLIKIEEDIFNSCIENGVLVARGSWFLTEKDKALKGLYFRVTFASASGEQMSEAISRFGEAVKKSFGVN
ncbi:unnamed protein product [Clonostachys chloroleuca]|uniref:aromatic-amino-acid transaminase n=1 Tax=Clonostachys chloroleuca TaxID=1926264 RepID=A0AA35QDD9_9HYPO|nr:unnamed protein product [Clonostachys chloroleuca]